MTPIPTKIIFIFFKLPETPLKNPFFIFLIVEKYSVCWKIMPIAKQKKFFKIWVFKALSLNTTFWLTVHRQVHDSVTEFFDEIILEKSSNGQNGTTCICLLFIWCSCLHDKGLISGLKFDTISVIWPRITIWNYFLHIHCTVFLKFWAIIYIFKLHANVGLIFSITVFQKLPVF